MKTLDLFRMLPLLLMLGSPLALFSQDDVTISKARLQELERKEKELEKLKQDQSSQASTNRGPAQLAPNSQAPGLAAPPAVTHQSPPLASLPPFKEGDEVDSMDLANYFRQNATAAEQRYRHHKIAVRGEIVGFETPMFRRFYRVLLKTADHEPRVICDLLTPDRYGAVFTVNHGSALVGTFGETQVPLAKEGDTIVVRGTCKGLREGVVTVTAPGFTPVK